MKDKIQVSGEKFGSVFGKDRIIESTEQHDLTHLFDTFGGRVAGLETILAKDKLLNIGWNKNYFKPITNNYPIYIHPDQSNIPGGEEFLRIIFGEQLFVITLLKSYFEYKPNSEYYIPKKEIVETNESFENN